MLYKEIIYMCSDLSKSITSDDAFFTEDHIRFLLNKHRSQLLYEKYKSGKEHVSESNYNTLCLDLEDYTPSCDDICNNQYTLRTVEKIPNILNVGSPRLYSLDYYLGDTTWVSRERMRYVGENKYMRNILYASLGPDNRIYLKSNSPLFVYLENIQFNAIFEDPDKTGELECSEECPLCNDCDPMEKEFKLEEQLVPQLILTVVQELTGAKFQPKDYKNNASDDLAELANFIRQNIKSPLAKQMTE